MLKIRLQRVGRKHEPVFRLVLTDSKSGPKSGKVIEILGSYDSRRGEEAKFKDERIKHWISNGAKTSDTVHNMLISKKMIKGKKINVLTMSAKRKKKIEEKLGASIPDPAESSAESSVEKEEKNKESEEKPEATSIEASTEVSTEKEEVKEETPKEAIKNEEKPIEEKEKILEVAVEDEGKKPIENKKEDTPAPTSEAVEKLTKSVDSEK